MVAERKGLRRQQALIKRANELFRRQREALRNRRCPGVAERSESIQRLRPALIRDTDASSEALKQDFGHRCADETGLAEPILSLPAGQAARAQSARLDEARKTPRRGHAVSGFGLGLYGMLVT